MTKEQKIMLVRIGLSALLTVMFSLIHTEGILRFILFLVPYLIIGYDILAEAVEGVKEGEITDENFLMAVATVGAMILGLTVSGDYTEAVAVMLFYQTGELFCGFATEKSRKSIVSLMDIRPDYANVERGGKLIKVAPEELDAGVEITVLTGERIPIDGVVTFGKSALDTSALTGESIPCDVSEGDYVTSGCICMTGMIRIRTTKSFGESTVSRILELAENASEKKSKSEGFISAFAKIYTPAVCIAAAVIATVPPILGLIIAGIEGAFGTWLYRALSFLVASCPCALVVSIPLSFFAAIGGASKAGILIKGSCYVEAMAKAGCVAFDKTGTLTNGVFKVSKICPSGISVQELTEYAALAESSSSHPIAKCILSAYGREPDRQRVTELCDLGGYGVTATVDGHKISVGNERLMARSNLNIPQINEIGSVVHVAIDGHYAGYFTVSDTVKPTAKPAIEKLNSVQIKETVMLTGDTKETAEAVAAELGIGKVESELLPSDKVEAVERLLEGMPKGEKLIFVGDGINDAPVLARADAGIAMGGMGSDAAIESADVVLMDDDPEKVAKAVKISQRCLAIVRQNTVFAISVKLLTLILVGSGLSGMWLAVFADVGVMVLSVANSIRALFIKKV